LSMGIAIGEGEMVLRCNLVAVKDGKMWDYSAGHITTPEARELIIALEKHLGSPSVQFFPGVSYRHILKLKGHMEGLEAVCTPPHDIPGQPVAPNLPKGKGSGLLKDLMKRSEPVLKDHPVNIARKSRGEVPATTIWLFWPSGQVPELPSFEQLYGVSGAMISGVDLLRGIAQMAKIDVVNVAGVTDGLDNDYAAQATGALDVLKNHDLAVVHVEAPDEAGHGGSVEHKIEAIEQTDKNIIKCLREYKSDGLRLLILPDHPTPIDIQTHTGEAVPFLLCGPGLKPNGSHRLTEAEGRAAGFRVEAGYDIIKMLIER
ncbi:MAG TPA: 2,3-bisphosphoglycerate-independent phosphoglycerate mutase, partial [Dehalococcoidales bacterium]